MQYPTFAEYLRAEYAGPFCATDIVIRHLPEKKQGEVIPYSAPIVLIERRNFPYGLAWPGGMGEKMTLAKNAEKEAHEETSLFAVLDSVYTPLCVLSELNQDPRAHIASITYTAQGYGNLKAADDAKEAHLVTVSELERLAQNEHNWSMPHHHKIATFYLAEIKRFIELENSVK